MVQSNLQQEIRSENTRSGWNSWSGLQSIPGWNTDINQAREQDSSGEISIQS